MKFNKIAFLIISLSIYFSIGTYAQIPQLSDRSKTGILTYFKAIIKDSLIIAGQECGAGNDTEKSYNILVEPLYANAQKYPGLIGIDYGYMPRNNLHAINQTIIMFWQKGGLITIDWTANNPFATGSSYNFRPDTSVSKTYDFKKLLKGAPESKEKTSYRAALLSIGEGLQELKQAGVTVLWRPFHEMNGAWFWWGINDIKNPGNQNDFRLLWQDMYNYFTHELGLNNLIWVYGPNATSNYTCGVTLQYPGNKYVDVLGVSAYNKDAEFKNYNELIKYNKPLVITETGPSTEAFGKYNEVNITQNLKGKAAYFLQWSSWLNAKVAIIDNVNYIQMMNNSATITLDKLK